MEGILGVVIWIAIFVFVMAAIGAPLTGIANSSRLPNWARINPVNSWGIPWFDSKPQLKKILIKFGQAVFVCAYFFINFMLAVIKAAAKMFFKTIEKSAKKAIK